MQAPGQNGIHWFELDYKEVTQRKAAIVAGHEPLRKVLGPENQQIIQPGKSTNAPVFVHAQPIAVSAFKHPIDIPPGEDAQLHSSKPPPAIRVSEMCPSTHAGPHLLTRPAASLLTNSCEEHCR